MTNGWQRQLVDIYDDPEKLTVFLLGDTSPADQVDALSDLKRTKLLQVSQDANLSAVGKQTEIDRLTTEFRANVDDTIARAERRIDKAEEELQKTAKLPAYMGTNREQAELVRAQIMQEANLLAGGPWEQVEEAFQRDLDANGPQSPHVDAWLRVLVPLAQKSGVRGAKLVLLQQHVEALREQQLSDRARKARSLLQSVKVARIGIEAAKARAQSQRHRRG